MPSPRALDMEDGKRLMAHILCIAQLTLIVDHAV